MWKFDILILVALFVLTVAISVAGQSPHLSKPVAVAELWPDGKIPGQGAVEPEKELPDRGDGVKRISNFSRPTIAVYPAKKKNATAWLRERGKGEKGKRGKGEKGKRGKRGKGQRGKGEK